MPNFQSTPMAPTTVPVLAVHVQSNAVFMYCAENTWVEYRSVEEALSWIRDNQAPQTITGSTEAYVIGFTWYANNAGPWSEQGAQS